MNHLAKIRKQNLKQFQKAQSYLQTANTDLNKISTITYAPLPPKPVERSSNMSVIHEQDKQEDSYGFGFDQYLQAKEKRETTQKREQTKVQATSQQPQNNKNIRTQGSFFDPQKYQYNPDDESDFKNEFPSKIKVEGKIKVAAKLGKNKCQIIQPIGEVITEQNLQGKKKLQDVFVSQVPLKINYIKANNKEWENFKKGEDYRLEYVLRNFPQIKSFKNNQKAIIKCLVENHNVFVCMPTGGGKSLTFQVLTFLIKGVYICVLPLISLIFDQQYQAKMFGIQVYSLTANTRGSQLKQIYQTLKNFKYSQKSILIFCTPEKINLNPQFSEILEMLYDRGHLKRFIIDQVHCVSTWGKDFREQYHKLSMLKQKYPKTPILGLTATVTEVVKQDIINRLGIEGCYYFQSSFNRPNLYYEVRPKSKTVLDDIEQIIHRYKGKTGIIYCLAKKQCEEISQKLNKRGYKTAYYHGDLSEEYKKNTQEEWMNNQIHIIVATVAFGMGINKPDVRFVIHYTLSKSLQNYYQQSGRAGRDGLFSQCILFYRNSDKQSLQSMNLQNDFSSLQRKQFSTKQLAQMIKYCQDKSTCRRQFQLHYLGETDFDPQTCNKTCDNCKKGQIYIQYECIRQSKCLVRFIMDIQKCKSNFSKKQIVDIIKGKAQKKINYKLERLERAEIDLTEIKDIFSLWKINEIENLIVQLMNYDLFTEKIAKYQVFKNNKETEVVTVYLKCNHYKCKVFLEQVETLPFKRLTKNKITTEYITPSLQQPNNETQPEEEEDTHQSYFEQRKLGVDEERAQKYQKYRKLLQDIFEQQLQQ